MKFGPIYFIFTHAFGDRLQFFHQNYRKKWGVVQSLFPVLLVKKLKPVAKHMLENEVNPINLQNLEVDRIYFIFKHGFGDRLQFFQQKCRKKWLYNSSLFPVMLVKKSVAKNMYENEVNPASWGAEVSNNVAWGKINENSWVISLISPQVEYLGGNLMKIRGFVH